MNVEQVTRDINTLSERVGRYIERLSIDHENLTNIILDVIRDLTAECACLRKERGEALAKCDDLRKDGEAWKDRALYVEKERDEARGGLEELRSENIFTQLIAVCGQRDAALAERDEAYKRRDEAVYGAHELRAQRDKVCEQLDEIRTINSNLTIQREDVFRIYNELMKKLENLVGKD